MLFKRVPMPTRLVLVLLSVFLFMTGSAVCETHVTLSDLHYGNEAHDMFIQEQPNFITFMDHEWSLDEVFAYEGANFFGGVHAHGLGDRNTAYRDLPRMMGGKTLSVYEYTVYKDDFSVLPSDEQVHLVTVELDIPYTTTLYVGVGNRETGEYVFEDPVTFDSVFSEPIYMPRDEKGRPAIVDRIYLYSYPFAGETRYYALTLYIDYDSYPAAYPAEKPAFEKAEPAETPAPEKYSDSAKEPSASDAKPDEKKGSADYQALMLFLENDMPISEEMIRRIVDSGEAEMEKLRVLLASYGAEFPIPEPTPEPIRSVPYQAMLLYLEMGQYPPQDIVKDAAEADQLTETDLTALYKTYGLSYKDTEPKSDNTAADANSNENEAASFDHTILSSRPGYTYYPDDDFWYYENAYVKTYADRYIEARIVTGGSGDELTSLPTFYFTYSDTDTNTSIADIYEVYVRVNDTTFSLPISASMFNTYGSFLYSKNGKALMHAMADADEIDLTMKTSKGFITETISGSDYAQTLKSAAKGIKSSNLYSVIDPEAEENEIRKALTPVSIVNYDYAEGDFIQHLLNEPGASVIFADEIYWTYALPYHTQINGNSLTCSLTFCGVGESITALPSFLCTLKDKDGQEIGISSISIRADGEVYPVENSANAFSSIALKADGTGYITGSTENITEIPAPPRYLNALADATNVSVVLTLSTGSVLEKVVLDTDLAQTIQAAAIKALEIVY